MLQRNRLLTAIRHFTAVEVSQSILLHVDDPRRNDNCSSESQFAEGILGPYLKLLLPKRQLIIFCFEFKFPTFSVLSSPKYPPYIVTRNPPTAGPFAG